MELKYAKLSPFGRKVLVVAHEVGIADQLVLTEVSTRGEPEKIAPFNPLGKIPILVTDTGAVLYDSGVICEYLDAEYGGHRLLPASGMRRWEVLTLLALADGVLEAGMTVRYERARPPAEQSASANEWQLRKVQAGLDAFERRVGQFGRELDLAQIGIVCALGYLPLRVEELADQGRWPKLAAWVERMNERDSFRRTRPELPA